ncbi:MAG TPA: FapA family protein [Spirochaetota bacterium]|nr:FapA family protein [Spirochaetota bacterium]
MEEVNNKPIDNNIKLEISADLIEAFISISLPRNEPWPDTDYIINLLNSNGISSTILKDEVTRIINEKIHSTPVCVARGVKMIPSVDGWIEYLYKKQEKEFDPADMDAVDHKNRSRIKTVSKGDRIIRLHPAVSGKDGISVTGEVITSGNAIDIKMPSGINTAVDPEDSSYLLATENGAVVPVNETRIDVVPLLEIQGNVDYSVGNIDFTGSIILRGDILSGFTVKCTGSIQVYGIIEDAEVYSGGDIYAHGCAGGQRGIIRAGGSITISYAVNSKMQAGKDIIAADYLINCVSHADGSIIVTKKKGMIAGGTSVAFSGIEANTIGNSSGLKTIVSAGFSAELRQQLTLIDSEQTKNIHDLGHINQALKKISRISMIKKQLPATIANQAKDLIKMKERIEEQINKVLEKQVTVLDTLSDIKNASIRVNGIMYPGVVINFPDIQKLIKDEVKKSILKIENGILKIDPVK